MSTGFVREIPDVEFVMEVIAERFDDALGFMTEGTIVYGGAVRDALAGMQICGDLDLSVSGPQYNWVKSAFESAAKWISTSDPRKAAPYRKLLSTAGPAIPAQKIRKIETFRNLHGMEAQILMPESLDSDNLMSAVSLAREVDIVCCAVFMTKDGRVFEAVPGAYDDCVNRLLRINKEVGPANVETLSKRVEKLVSRGWKSEIDLRAAATAAGRARRKKQKSDRTAPTMSSSAESILPPSFDSLLEVSTEGYNVTEARVRGLVEAPMASTGSKKATKSAFHGALYGSLDYRHSTPIPYPGLPATPEAHQVSPAEFYESVAPQPPAEYRLSISMPEKQAVRIMGDTSLRKAIENSGATAKLITSHGPDDATMHISSASNKAIEYLRREIHKRILPIQPACSSEE